MVYNIKLEQRVDGNNLFIFALRQNAINNSCIHTRNPVIYNSFVDRNMQKLNYNVIKV